MRDPLWSRPLAGRPARHPVTGRRDGMGVHAAGANRARVAGAAPHRGVLPQRNVARPARCAWADRLALLAYAAAATGLALVTDQPAHRIWGLVAGAGYLLLAATPLARRPAVPWAAGVVGGVLPLAVLVAARGGAAGPGPFAQPEVWVIEDAARRWLATGSPYPSAAETVAAAGPDGWFPYLPGMALFGMPRTVLGDLWWTDARLVLAAVAVTGCAVGVRCLLPPGAAPGPAAGWLLAGNPLVGLTLATGGHDLALAGLLVAALGLVRRAVPDPGRGAAGAPHTRAAVAAGLVAGLAVGTKPTAWPVVLVLLVLLVSRARRSDGRRCAAAMAGPALLLVVPVLLTAPALLVEHLVTFPAGMAAVPSPAGSPLPGAWLTALPGGRVLALAALSGAAAVALVRLRIHPPADAAAAARFAAAALTAGMLLAPSSRVGWFVVPLLLAGAVTVETMTARERIGRILGAVTGRGHSVEGMDPASADSSLAGSPGEPAPKVAKSDAEWREQLTPAEYQVLRKAGTERPFTGEYTDTKTQGLYSCRACGAELFRSDTKFESHCGWPSFFTPLAGEAVIERSDFAMGMKRTEVLCATCHSHLGHVFEGEGYGTPTDLRYCINSVSLRLTPDA